LNTTKRFGLVGFIQPAFERIEKITAPIESLAPESGGDRA